MFSNDEVPFLNAVGVNSPSHALSFSRDTGSGLLIDRNRGNHCVELLDVGLPLVMSNAIGDQFIGIPKKQFPLTLVRWVTLLGEFPNVHNVL